MRNLLLNLNQTNSQLLVIFLLVLNHRLVLKIKRLITETFFHDVQSHLVLRNDVTVHQTNGSLNLELALPTIQRRHCPRSEDNTARRIPLNLIKGQPRHQTSQFNFKVLKLISFTLMKLNLKQQSEMVEFGMKPITLLCC